MLRNISPSMLADLRGGLMRFAVLILIKRFDGVRLGFCTGDKDILAFRGPDGITDDYLAADSGGISAIQTKSGSGVDNGQVTAIVSDRISETDYEAGLYDGARVVVYLVNRANLAAGAIIALSGFLGQIQEIDAQLTSEILSLTSLLKANAGNLTSKECRALCLGNPQCKVNLAGTTRDGSPVRESAAVTSVSPDGIVLTFVVSSPRLTDFYSYGRIKANDGPNAVLGFIDIKEGISTSDAEHFQITLRNAFPFPVTVGEFFTLEAGCDRLFPTCRDKFANANNFHGEAQLPGNEKINQVARPPQG